MNIILISYRFGKRAGQPGLMERDVKDSSADQEVFRIEVY